MNLKKNIPTNICTCNIKQNFCITSYYPTVSVIQIKTSPRVGRCDKAACIYNVSVCRKGAPSDAQGQFGITQCSTKAIWQAQGGGGTSGAAWDKAGQDRVERGRAGERCVCEATGSCHVFSRNSALLLDDTDYLLKQNVSHTNTKHQPPRTWREKMDAHALVTKAEDK